MSKEIYGQDSGKKKKKPVKMRVGAKQAKSMTKNVNESLDALFGKEPKWSGRWTNT